MKILILGTGVIGTFLGFALNQSGNNVTHLVRKNKSSEEIPKSISLNFQDVRNRKPKSVTEEYKYKIEQSWENIKNYELIVIPVKNHQLKQAINDLVPYLSKENIVTISGNIWDEEVFIKDSIPCPYLFAFPQFGGYTMNNKLHGWLTKKITLGNNQIDSASSTKILDDLLSSANFQPKIEGNIIGWLMTHFAWNSGLITQALNEGSARNMANNYSSISKAFKMNKEAMTVVKSCGINFTDFDEGRKAMQPIWWNTIKNYVAFKLPGVVEAFENTKDEIDWKNYSKKISKTASENNLKLKYFVLN